MSAPLPPITPDQQSKIDQFHSACSEVLDAYLAGVQIDMNRHAVKHGLMPEERAVFDLALLLSRDVPREMLAGITALAIIRGIARKRKGKG
jgi:hypothetical protein